jgi:hypothetical protein
MDNIKITDFENEWNIINLKNLSPDIKRTNSDDFVELIENLSRIMFYY